MTAQRLQPRAAAHGATDETDVVVLGGGHNGLVCAFYLARAGLKVCVLERRELWESARERLWAELGVWLGLEEGA